MNRRRRLRVALPLICAVVIVAVAVGTGREVNVGYLVAATVGLSALLWLAMDLMASTAYPSWQVTAAYTPRQPGTDPRLARFTERLTSGVDRDSVAMDVHRVLVAAIDERLERLHGIDRHSDPVAAGRVLGPELTTFIDSDPHLNRTGQARQIAAVLNRIEEL